MDLVIVKGVKPVACVEIKLTTAPSVSRGMTQSIMDLGCKNNYIVTPGEAEPWKIREDITVYGLRDFLAGMNGKLLK